MMSNKPILLIEDDQIDSLMVKRAFTEINLKNDLIIAENGEVALGWLRNNKRIPCIILLDLNMPRMNGHEFLSHIKSDEYFKMIPVVVLTTSNDIHDKIEAFKKSVAGYMLKSIDYDEFVSTLKTIDAYWTASQLPE